MIDRRALFTVASGVFAGGALLSPRSLGATEKEAPAKYGEVSPKDARFGAVGDGNADDTAALQNAADECFGTETAAHGANAANLNKVFWIPGGHYKITSPIKLRKLQGARIIGAGRFVTKITNVAGGPVLVTNGCSYSHFEGLCLETSGSEATVFDLNWDGSAGGAALQSNTFVDIFFSGGAIGVDVGADGFMGSENLFLNCFWINQATAGLKTSNFNALQNTVIGGNFQNCEVALWVQRGSVPLVESVGFQLSKVWDVRVDNSANDTITILSCRTESSNFVRLNNGVHACILGCSQIEGGKPGYFLQPGDCPTTVERCVSLHGQIALNSYARLAIRGSSFGRNDWLVYSTLKPGELIELEDVQYGGTPNSRNDGPVTRIARRRITSEGVFVYSLRPAE